jgi:hypothetical protein
MPWCADEHDLKGGGQCTPELHMQPWNLAGDQDYSAFQIFKIWDLGMNRSSLSRRYEHLDSKVSLARAKNQGFWA